jgi:glycosyltransferase involved in cell wall biosynthesis
MDFLRLKKEKQNSTTKGVAKVEEPLVSIIIATYNYGHYLADAIESALKQTYKSIEVIVIDDGSTDNTKDVVSRYPVQYFFQKNQGVAIARNNGIKRSHGEFFVCLDADDKLAPEYIGKTMQIMMKDSRIGFVRTGSTLWNEELGIENILMPRKVYSKYDIIAIGWVGALGAVLTRRVAFESLDYGFDESLPAHEDVDFCFRLCLKGWKTEAVFEPLHWYRIHESSRNPKTVQRAKYTASFLYRKFPSRKIFEQLYTFYIIPLRRIKSLINNPTEYLKGIKKKIQTKLWIKSYRWNNPINQRKAEDIFHEIWIASDNLLEWFRNKDLREYYTRRLKTLDFHLQKIIISDAREKQKRTTDIEV